MPMLCLRLHEKYLEPPTSWGFEDLETSSVTQQMFVEDDPGNPPNRGSWARHCTQVDGRAKALMREISGMPQ